MLFGLNEYFKRKGKKFLPPVGQLDFGGNKEHLCWGVFVVPQNSLAELSLYIWELAHLIKSV